MPVRKYRRETSEISCCLKYLLFASNVILWLAALVVLSVGIWAWSEKDMFRNITRLHFIALDPAFVLIMLGGVAFLLGFLGSVGALRENTCLLAAYAIFLSVLLIAEIGFCALAFVLKDKGWIKDQATEGLKAFIRHYREDADQQNLIDWIQEDWLQCCGIDGPKDWDSNNYFNCSSIAIGSREACGVPFSCCRRRPQEVIKNKQCGYDVRKEGYGMELSRIIYEKGCVQAGEEWMEHNLIIISTAVIVVMFFQVFIFDIYYLFPCTNVRIGLKRRRVLGWRCTNIFTVILENLYREALGQHLLDSKPPRLLTTQGARSLGSTIWI